MNISRRTATIAYYVTVIVLIVVVRNLLYIDCEDYYDSLPIRILGEVMEKDSNSRALWVQLDTGGGEMHVGYFTDTAWSKIKLGDSLIKEAGSLYYLCPRDSSVKVRYRNWPSRCDSIFGSE